MSNRGWIITCIVEALIIISLLKRILFMKRSTKIFIIILVIFLVLCHIDFRPWFYERQKEYLNRVDETRKDYNIGSCYNMQEDLCYYIIFIDDDESQWNDADKNEFIEKKFEGSLPAFVAAFSKSKKLSKTDIDEIKKIIENAGE